MINSGGKMLKCINKSKKKNKIKIFKIKSSKKYVYLETKKQEDHGERAKTLGQQWWGNSIWGKEVEGNGDSREVIVEGGTKKKIES